MIPNNDSRQEEVPEKLRDLYEAIKWKGEVPPSPNFEAKVWAEIERRQARRGFFARFWQRWPLTPVPVLASLLVLSLSLNVWLGYRSHTPFEEQWGKETTTRPRSAQEVSDQGAAELQRADSYAARGEYENALRSYQKVLQVEGAPLALLYGRIAALHYRFGQYPETIEAATMALALNPSDALAYRYRGAAYDKLGKRPRAIENLERAEKLGDTEAGQMLRAWGIAP